MNPRQNACGVFVVVWTDTTGPVTSCSAESWPKTPFIYSTFLFHYQDGQQYGDEYLAELDYIEVVERNKEGYESDVEMPDDDTDEESKGGDDSDR